MSQDRRYGSLGHALHGPQAFEQRLYYVSPAKVRISDSCPWGLPVYIYVYVHMTSRACVCVRVCVDIYRYTQILMYVYAHVHTHRYVHVYTYTILHVQVCIYIYAYILQPYLPSIRTRRSWSPCGPFSCDAGRVEAADAHLPSRQEVRAAWARLYIYIYVYTCE